MHASRPHLLVGEVDPARVEHVQPAVGNRRDRVVALLQRGAIEELLKDLRQARPALALGVAGLRGFVLCGMRGACAMRGRPLWVLCGRRTSNPGRPTREMKGAGCLILGRAAKAGWASSRCVSVS
eukprot:357988-Chlamydomonas_euryale.AAC.3